MRRNSKLTVVYVLIIMVIECYMFESTLLKRMGLKSSTKTLYDRYNSIHGIKRNIEEKEDNLKVILDSKENNPLNKQLLITPETSDIKRKIQSIQPISNVTSDDITLQQLQIKGDKILNAFKLLQTSITQLNPLHKQYQYLTKLVADEISNITMTLIKLQNYISSLNNNINIKPTSTDISDIKSLINNSERLVTEIKISLTEAEADPINSNTHISNENISLIIPNNENEMNVNNFIIQNEHMMEDDNTSYILIADQNVLNDQYSKIEGLPPARLESGLLSETLFFPDGSLKPPVTILSTISPTLSIFNFEETTIGTLASTTTYRPKLSQTFLTIEPYNSFNELKKESQEYPEITNSFIEIESQERTNLVPDNKPSYTLKTGDLLRSPKVESSSFYFVMPSTVPISSLSHYLSIQLNSIILFMSMCLLYNV